MKKNYSLAKCCITIFLILFIISTVTLTMLIVNGSAKTKPIFLLLLILVCSCLAFFVFSVCIPVKKYLDRCKKYSFFQTNELLSQINPPFWEQKAVIDIITNKFEFDAEIKASNQQAEYLALQNQINPHFLYNALEAIRSDAIAYQISDIANATKALAKFFRYTISETGIKFSVEDELRNIDNYFLIQNYRFGNRLSLNIDCSYEDRDVMDCLLPKLTLQPLVENAIQHGIENKISGGAINIAFELTDSKLIIHVKDNGEGMDTEALERLNESLNDNKNSMTKTDGHKSIALQNINRRIKLLFGAEYGLKIISLKGLGTDAIVTVPRSYENH